MNPTFFCNLEPFVKMKKFLNLPLLSLSGPLLYPYLIYSFIFILSPLLSYII